MRKLLPACLALCAVWCLVVLADASARVALAHAALAAQTPEPLRVRYVQLEGGVSPAMAERTTIIL